jgi:hypothetical protein
MAYNATKTRTWKDGTTPATGTLALGSLFEAEYNRLYDNTNFLKAYFPTDNRLTINEIDSISGNGINFLDPIGYNIAAPVTQLQLYEGTSGSCLAHFTNLTTGAALGNGFSVGLDSSENAILHNRHNSNMLFYTNNLERVRVNNAGLIGVGINSPLNLLHLKSKGTSTFPFLIENSISSNPLLRIGQGASDNGYMQIYDSAGVVQVQLTSGAGNFITGGNLGVGFTNPNELLHLHESTSDQAYMQFTNSTTGTTTNDGLTIGITASEQASIMFKEAEAMFFGTNNVGRMWIRSNGLVGIGLAIANTKLHLHDGSSDAVYLQFTNTTTGTGTTDGFVSGVDASEQVRFWNYENTDMYFGTNGAERMRIKNTGIITIPGTTESTSKDTGALIVEGGVGIEKNLSIGGDLQDGSGNPVAGWLADGTPFYKKIIEIGDWNMDTTSDIAKPHGLSLSSLADIVGIKVFIRNDLNTIVSDFVSELSVSSSENLNKYLRVSLSNVLVGRDSGGFFDSTNYDSTSYNRGWIIIEYV